MDRHFKEEATPEGTLLKAIPGSEPGRKNPGNVEIGGVLIDGVSKRFRKFTNKKRSYDTVKSTLISRLFGRAKSQPNETVALDNLSVEVKPGSSLGIIGRNGSGKSTLLKLIAGIYRPDTGRVLTKGRLSALIELGAGFHPDFTGRENVFLAGVMYGLTRAEIEQRFEKIVEYAELEDFIDDPVRTYSSGMYMRLGFSVAIFSEPEILLIDEVLAVGDASFIHKCQGTIGEFKRQGKTLIFVTHDLNSVIRWCDEAVWLEKGIVKKRGEPRYVIDSYLENVAEGEELELEKENLLLPDKAIESEQTLEDSEAIESSQTEDLTRWGNRDVEITEVRMLSAQGEERWLFQDDEDVIIEVNYKIHHPVESIAFGIGIIRSDGISVHGTNTDIDGIEVPIPEFSNTSSSRNESDSSWSGKYIYKIHHLGLLEDTYYLDVAAHKSDGTPFDYHHRRYKFSVRSAFSRHGVFSPEHSWGFAVNYQARSLAQADRTLKAVRANDSYSRLSK